MGPENKKRVHATRMASKASNFDQHSGDDQKDAEQQNSSMIMKTKGQSTNEDTKKKSSSKIKANSRQPQGSTPVQQNKQQQSTRKNRQGNLSNKQSIASPDKDGYDIDEDEDDQMYYINNEKNKTNKQSTIHQNIYNQHVNKGQVSRTKEQILNNLQSPQSVLEESKENTSECNSTSSKLRRSGRNNVDSKCSSSNKTSSMLVSPSKYVRTSKRGHGDDQNLDELEPNLRKKIQQSFIEDKQKMGEHEIDAEDNNLVSNTKNIQQNKMNSMELENFLHDKNIYDEDNHNYLKDDNILINSRQNYRQPKQKISNKAQAKQYLNSQDETKEQQIFSQEKEKTYQTTNSSQNGNHPNSRISRSSESVQEPETELSQPKIRIQKINFNGFSDSDDCTGDSNSNNNNTSVMKSTNNKKASKSVTLIFQRSNKQTGGNSIKDEIDGQSQSIQSGNLLIQICNTDEHYPPLFDQSYLEDNIALIQKKQCHVRQKRRLLQLDTINSISIDKDNRLYNLLDENVIKERDQGNLQILNGIVEYEQSLRPQPVTKQKIKCNCKKTKCLKLYCDCFNQGIFCSPECNCTECSNRAENKDQREAAMKQLQERNPDAFKPKIQTKEDDEEIMIHGKGCNCKKSGCEKKYCECYNTGVKCSDQCKCEGCRNRDPSQLVKINNNNPSTGNSSLSSHLQGSLKNGEQYLNQDNSYMHQNSNLIGNHHFLMKQSQEDSLHFSQNSKNFKMNDFTNIPIRLPSFMGDSQNNYTQKRSQIMPISSFNYSQEDEFRYSQNMSFKQGSFGGFSQNKGGLFDESSQRSNIYKQEDNTTLDISLQNGQIKKLITKQE